ncbi:MAG: cytochrome C biosynthesis protein [Desulfovibrio sp.]|nr:cytochrome C biosynthesis protein [Desulfovibrio sp.]
MLQSSYDFSNNCVRERGLLLTAKCTLCRLVAYVTLLSLSVPQIVFASTVHPKLDVAWDGQDLVAALRVVIPEQFHAYAHNPGEAGRPATLSFSVDAGDALPVRYPEGAIQRDFYDPSATIYVYEGEVDFFLLLPADAVGKAYRAELSLLLCSTRKCMPVTEHLAGTVPQTRNTILQASWGKEWLRGKGLPVAAGSAGQEDGMQTGATLGIDGFEEAPLPPPDSFGVRLSPRYQEESLEISGLGKALLFGILAGLLLNVMPCVLPVLTFKVSGLLLVSGRGREGIRQFRQYNLCFAAGILTLFSLLAVILGLADLMWGQLFQSETVLLVLLLLVFLMGLSALGVFHLPVINLKLGVEAKNPCLSAYLTGLVSTFLATPCSGPLLGGVLAWAFMQSFPVLMAVFWAVGLGMALPYLLFSCWPLLTHVLPKPGSWMQTFERVVGFLLLGTALYLLSLLPVERHMSVLSMLLAISVCAWLWGRHGSVSATLGSKLLYGFSVVTVALAFVWGALRPAEPLPQWHSFEPETFEGSLGKRPMLLEFTANWCPNCKFLEATVLTSEFLRQIKARYGIDFVRVDLSDTDAYAMRLLRALGSKSIPLTALFPSGDMAKEPLVLRDVYGKDSLEQALRTVFGK